ncbi:LAMI_0H14246g1_1 [Lachancea mirantina]|uniref:LAMI_0H14246g1_1 n=1 Tax=Lachancea mirantina TaxID=1230905 RepID=A0A1G4KI90_9SACH|nr:LAMI_0H14246g1_1 [Lachancea mirantina]
MAEQITHKRPIKIQFDRPQRKLLQDYYHLKADGSNHPKDAESDPEKANNVFVDRTSSKNSLKVDRTEPATSSSDDLLKNGIKGTALKDLVHVHNTLLSKETATNSTIKNTIYDNYYDLLKVNELLKEVAQEAPEHADLLKKALAVLRGDLEE